MTWSSCRGKQGGRGAMSGCLTMTLCSLHSIIAHILPKKWISTHICTHTHNNRSYPNLSRDQSYFHISSRIPQPAQPRHLERLQNFTSCSHPFHESLPANHTLWQREAQLWLLTWPRPGCSSEILSDPRAPQCPIRLNRRLACLALSSSTDSNHWFSITENDILPCIGRCRPHYPLLNWHMDVDCHACPGSVINSS